MSLTSYRAAPPRVTHLTYADLRKIATGICLKVGKCLQKTSRWGLLGCFQGLRLAALPLMPPDEIDIARIYAEPQSLPQHENRVYLVDRVEQQAHPASEAKIPERLWHNALLDALACNDLQDKAHRKHRLREEAKGHPKKLGPGDGRPPMGKPRREISQTHSPLRLFGFVR